MFSVWVGVNISTDWRQRKAHTHTHTHTHGRETLNVHWRMAPTAPGTPPDGGLLLPSHSRHWTCFPTHPLSTSQERKPHIYIVFVYVREGDCESAHACTQTQDIDLVDVKHASMRTNVGFHALHTQRGGWGWEFMQENTERLQRVGVFFSFGRVF